MAVVREYDPQRDVRAVWAVWAVWARFVELQEAERKFEPEVPPGEEAADAYLKLILAGCEKWDGQVSVAEVENETVG